MKYFRTNNQDTNNEQTFYVTDNNHMIMRAKTGIADFIKTAETTNLWGLDLIEIDGYEYDRALQQYLKERHE